MSSPIVEIDRYPRKELALPPSAEAAEAQM
jgi:hypothetical protein